MTEKLFYEDAFLKEFSGTVLDCREEKGKWAVLLDRTAFYPEGGGQPADVGILNDGSLGGVSVRDVREKDGEIVHFCDRHAGKRWGYLSLLRRSFDGGGNCGRLH